MKNPHIQRDSTYGWICFGQGSVGVGPSPLQAYRKWRIELATNDLFHSALEEIQKTALHLSGVSQT